MHSICYRRQVLKIVSMFKPVEGGNSFIKNAFILLNNADFLLKNCFSSYKSQMPFTSVNLKNNSLLVWQYLFFFATFIILFFFFNIRLLKILFKKNFILILSHSMIYIQIFTQRDMFISLLI